MSAPVWPDALVAKVMACKLAGHMQRESMLGLWLLCARDCAYAARLRTRSDDDSWDNALWLEYRDGEWQIVS